MDGRVIRSKQKSSSSFFKKITLGKNDREQIPEEVVVRTSARKVKRRGKLRMEVEGRRREDVES